MYTLMQPPALPRRTDLPRLAGPPAPHLLAPYPPVHAPPPPRAPADGWPAQTGLPDEGTDGAC